MVIYNCPKCKKEYKTQGVFYQKHIKMCTGPVLKQKSKKVIKHQKSSGNNEIVFKRLESIERRLVTLEEKFNK